MFSAMRRAEQERFLRDEPDDAAQHWKRNLPNIDAVDEHGAGRRIVQAAASRLSSVDLPEPVAPTMAVVVPAGRTAETSFSTDLVAVGERQMTELDVAANLFGAR